MKNLLIIKLHNYFIQTEEKLNHFKIIIFSV